MWEFGVGDWMPKKKDSDGWWTTTCQVFVGGFFLLIALGFLCIFFWVFIPLIVYFVGASLYRGIANRIKLFSDGHLYDESCWWDGWICFLFWMSSAFGLGYTFGIDTAVGCGLCAFTIFGLLEMVFYATQHMEMPGLAATKQIQWGGVNHTFNHVGNFNNVYAKPKKPSGWYWSGYQENDGPREDILFPVKSQTS